jgi:hypothetical protein
MLPFSVPRMEYYLRLRLDPSTTRQSLHDRCHYIPSSHPLHRLSRIADNYKRRHHWRIDSPARIAARTIPQVIAIIRTRAVREASRTPLVRPCYKPRPRYRTQMGTRISPIARGVPSAQRVYRQNAQRRQNSTIVVASGLPGVIRAQAGWPWITPLRRLPRPQQHNSQGPHTVANYGSARRTSHRGRLVHQIGFEGRLQPHPHTQGR